MNTKLFRHAVCNTVLLLLCPFLAGAARGVQINEIMYHPGHNVGEPEDARQEYIELYNDSSNEVDMAGWSISRGVTYEFPEGTLLAPNQYLVVAADVVQFRSIHQDTETVIGNWTGRLTNSGESITLVDVFGNIIDEVEYCDQGDWSYHMLGPIVQGYAGWEWANEHDGEGKSLELVNSNLPNEYGQNWQASSSNNGTPGRQNSVSSPDVAPFIIDVAHEPIIPTSSQAVTVSANVVDYSTGPVDVEVFYRIDDSKTFDSMAMVNDGDGDSFIAILPAQDHGTIVEFHVEATDQANNSRTWPAPARPGSGQLTNALYQVDDSFDVNEPWSPGSQPVYYLIMTDAEKRRLEDMWTTSTSDAQMNGTFICRDGAGIQYRYNVGIRNRGNIRGLTPISFRVNFVHDDPWHGITALNVNSKYPHSQLMGSALFKLAGLVAADAAVIQLRVNGLNLAVPDGLMYGSYVAVEVLDSDFVDCHFPYDRSGNLYRLKDASNSGVPGLVYEGDGASAYRDTYFKQTNEASEDWRDLIDLTYALNHTLEDGSLEEIRDIVNLDQWVRFLAVDTLAGNLEGGLTSGRGDDVALYRGVDDQRFVLIPHDLDTLLGQGDLPPDPNRNVFTYAMVQGLNQLLDHPEVVRLYYQQLTELTETIFGPKHVDSLARQLLGEWIPKAKIDEIRQYARNRNAHVLDQIEQDVKIVCDLPTQQGYFHTNVPQVNLRGTANAIRTESVLVNGEIAQWDQKSGTWISGTVFYPYIGLRAGINRVKVQAFDGPEGTGQERQIAHVDISYDSGSENTVAGITVTDTTWDALSGTWHVVADVSVPAGITLTILPGTTVFFDPNTNLTIRGRLLAIGSPYAPIHFTRTPDSGGTWNGIQFIDTLEDNQIIHAVVEYGRTEMGMVGADNSIILVDTVLFDNTDLTRLRTVNSSAIVQNSIFTDIFPTGAIPSTDNQSEQILGIGVASNGYLIIRNNLFGTTKGHNDVVDVTGPVRPGPVVEIIDNVFRGGGDELLDLGGDAYVEGNVFMNVHKDEYNVSSSNSNAISTGDDNSVGIIDVVRNIFYDVDHAVSLKNNTFMFFEHNLVMKIPNDLTNPDVRYSAISFLSPSGDAPGKGAFLSGNVFANIPKRIFDHVDENYDMDSAFTTDLNMHYTLIEPDRVSDRVGKQVLPILNLGSGNRVGDPRVMVDKNKRDFSFKAGSYALGAGPTGSDIGPFIPAGAQVSNEPHMQTFRSDATLNVFGPGITHYKYWVNDSPISGEIPIDIPIHLHDLPDGDYTVYVVGKNAAGAWRSIETPTISKTWTIDTSWSQVVINEILAANDSLVEIEGGYPDIVELHNSGPIAVELGGLRMTDDPLQPSRFIFPKGTSIPSEGYLVLYADDNQAAPGIHLGFSLDRDGESLYLFDSHGNILDCVEFGLQVPDLSIGRAGHNNEWALTNPTFGMANAVIGLGDSTRLVINEWLAHSEVVFADDFVELHNPDTLPVAIGGLYLTDDPIAEPNKHEIRPLSFIAGSDYAVFTADGQPENAENHVSFRLSAQQEMIGLSTVDHEPIDTVIYAPQTLDVSQGRSPDGADELAFFALPTPGSTNFIQTTQTRTINLVAIDDLWSYDNSGTDWGAQWREFDFWDAQTWPAGQALLGGGFREQSLPESVNTEMSTDATTFYFRKEFYLDFDMASVDSLEISAILDDGAVFFLNGVEVLRLGVDRVMGQDNVYYDQYANRSISRPSYEGPFLVSAESLRRGGNLMAVEVHQSSDEDADDVLFGLELDVTITQILRQDDQLQNQLALLRGLRITEIMYRPIKGSDYEFIELTNVGTEPLDLTGVRFSRSIRFTFPEIMLDPAEHIVVVSNMSSFRSSYGSEARIAGEYEGKLNNGGESILLQLPEPTKAAILRFRYDDSWLPETDGQGYSLVIQEPHAPANTWSSSGSWRRSADLSGSPGR